ncbi:DNA repair protein RecN [Arcanobacterium buesumense]|uniref:DNA repair protein RecN n=1 Tax=Arcanobacterium buesumense TaxID=2722751 RepID=A0A6H2EJV0_9ACTO|nr:DNA repair protein RecN [Arcanobacterium buesumense]QJC21848.1 DNA repair protein RecN [Arcanobacterium buesumense]
MIEELQIKDLGVIEQAHVHFGPGLNALTGETGAGKTMALTSLMMLMGNKIDSAKVRVGAQAAVVDGTFVVDGSSPAVNIVQNAGGNVDFDGDQAIIYISRHLPASGRTKAYVGGHPVPLAVLKELSEHLVTVHGQTDQLRLKAPKAQRDALDEFGGNDIAEAIGQYRNSWDKYQALLAEREDFRSQVAQAGTERLALEALITRVDAIQPRVGEEDELKAQAILLENIEDVRHAMTESVNALDSEDNGALYQLDQAVNYLEKIANSDPEIADMVVTLRELNSRASDISNELGRRLSLLDADPEKLNAIHERRAQLKTLQQDLGMGLAEIIDRRAHADERLAEIANPQQVLEDITLAVEQEYERLTSYGEQLHRLRVKYGQKLGKQVSVELAKLAMKDATFSVSVTLAKEPGMHGMDQVEFQLAPHRGSPLFPLGQTASGGEMSRVMLALEVVLAQDIAVRGHTFIFDEVDAGIGGKTALSIGERLAILGRKCQVIAVTHLAQVAAYATRHITVQKSSSQSGGITDVSVLDQAQRTGELARMLSGHEESEAALAHAAELLRSVHMS